MTVSRSQPSMESLLSVEDQEMLDGVLIDHLKARIVKLERGLTWIVNSPGAHPANMVKVAEDALSHRSAKT